MSSSKTPCLKSHPKSGGVAQIIAKSPPLSLRSGSIFPCEEPKTFSVIMWPKSRGLLMWEGCVHPVCVGTLKTGNLGSVLKCPMCEVPFSKPLPLPGLSSCSVSVSVECLFVLLARGVQPSFPDIILEAGLHFIGVCLVPSGKHWLLMWTRLPLLAKLSLILEFHYLCLAPGLTLFCF